MTQLVTRQGQQQLNFTNWLITNEYDSGDVVFKDNNIYISNAIIPTNTPFTIGTTGATWKVAITGYDMDLDPPLLIASSGIGFGRCHTWGNRIFRAGSGDTVNMGNMYAGGMDNSDCTIEFTCLDELPEAWVKIQDMRSNFYGLGSNGILYVAGVNTRGQTGLGQDEPTQFQVVQNHRPEFYGPGITVLNFWATDVLTNTNAYTCQCWVQVDDNGIIRLYSFGDNGWGCIGNGTESDVQYSPLEHPQMRDKVIKTMSIYFFRNSDGGRGGLTVSVTEDGEVWNTGGNNTDGELGVGYNTSNTLVLTRAKFNATTYVTGAVDCDISYRSGDGIATHILLADGTVYSSGKNDYGRLGRGNIDGTNIPFYQQVLTAPNTPLTGIVKLKTSVNGLVAMNSEGLVYTTGRNYDGWWGNGQANFANGNGYAAMKQGGVKDFWLNPNGVGWSAAWWLMKDGTLWASGHNEIKQMGSVDTADAQNPTIRRVPLPTGEYPVQFKWIGGVYDGNLIGAGVLMVSNKNKLYTWGKPYVSASSVKNVDTLRFPHCIVDFYDPQQF
jgi:hypothetical protein